MATFIDFNSLAILNLLVALLWLASASYIGDRRDPIGIIVLILAAVAVVFNIVFIVLKFVH